MENYARKKPLEVFQAAAKHERDARQWQQSLRVIAELSSEGGVCGLGAVRCTVRVATLGSSAAATRRAATYRRLACSRFV